ncbi:phage tail domain-containing protein [Bacillus velezensis]|uniref:phage tail domain-containing protein n=1 Tax=Bacillus velezensis TaxID=492670 RepID=UPI0021E99607|nr:phage tail domain-containing protein [Bacillus velezensis]MCV3200031.1 phage tail family protein [Bacillus velezensis]
MIRESLYFLFNNEKSSDYGVTNVNTDSGLVEEPFLGSRTVNETYVKGRPEPYTEGVKQEPKQFPLNFYLGDHFDEKNVRAIKRWLSVDDYKPFAFSQNLDIVYYAMPVDTADLVHNAARNGYVRLTMKCNSPYAYSRNAITHTFDISSGTEIVELHNKGDVNIFPSLEILKIGDGDIKIENLSDFSEPFLFSNLKDKELLKINGEKEIIESNLYGNERYDDFNDQYLRLGFGRNRLKVTGNCKLRFSFRYKYL